MEYLEIFDQMLWPRRVGDIIITVSIRHDKDLLWSHLSNGLSTWYQSTKGTTEVCNMLFVLTLSNPQLKAIKYFNFVQ